MSMQPIGNPLMASILPGRRASSARFATPTGSTTVVRSVTPVRTVAATSPLASASGFTPVRTVASTSPVLSEWGVTPFRTVASTSPVPSESNVTLFRTVPSMSPVESEAGVPVFRTVPSTSPVESEAALTPRRTAPPMASASVTFPHVLYVTLSHYHGKLKRKTLQFRLIHNNHGYWAGKHLHLYYDGGYVFSKLPPTSDDPHILAVCNEPPKTRFAVPVEGWESSKYTVSVAVTKPVSWIEGDVSEAKERLGKLLAAIGKKETGADGWCITIRDICRNIEEVKEILPELLKDYHKIDTAGNGHLTIEELETYFDPVQKKDFSIAKLEEIWKIIMSQRPDDSKSKDWIDMEDLAASLDFIDEKIPALIESFQDIDVKRNCRIDREEFNAFFGDGLVWLDMRLRSMIGLGKLKEQIKQFHTQQYLDRLRRRHGVIVNNDEAMVIVLKGSPGTGKTSIGRLLTGLLFKIGVIQRDVFIECQRDDLVGDHIGASEKLTAAKIEEAKGGVLFVDEAYRLNSDVFGVEAINSLMRAMTVKGTVMILAGYPNQMEEFKTTNPGIQRRITYEMEFPDYSIDDLSRILKTQVEKRGYQVDVPLETITKLISKHAHAEQLSCFNGGVGEHISRHAIFHLNARLIPKVNKDPSFIPGVNLEEIDLEYGCKFIPMPPAEVIQTVTSKRDSRTSGGH